jgi:hypothetical protein
MTKIRTDGWPPKPSPEFLKKYPNGIAAKELVDALETLPDAGQKKPTDPQSSSEDR